MGGVQAVTRSTPATFAVTTVMWAEAVSGSARRGCSPGRGDGRCFCPRKTPGWVSTSNARIDSSWCCAKVRTLACTVRRSSRTSPGTVATIRSISSGPRRKLSGDQLSNFSE